MIDIIKHLQTTFLYPQWQKIKIRHHHGINIALFSLKTKTTQGIGDFYSLIPLIDWCSHLGFDIIQLLPLNELLEKTFSPYDNLSSCALDPIYINLNELPYTTDLLNSQLLDFKDLNTSERVRYKEVKEKKLLFLNKYFNLAFNFF